MSSKIQFTLEMASEALSVLKSRSAAYDNNVLPDYASTEIMRILYPDGMLDTGLIEWIRFRYISWMVEKLCRFRRNPDTQHLVDVANYAFLLGAAEKAEMEKANENNGISKEST